MSTWKATKQRQTKRFVSGASLPSAADCCLKIVDSCLAAIIFVAPLLLGGRHLFGRMVFICLACIAGVAWLTRQALLSNRTWTPTFAHLLGLAAIALVTLQITPLPPEWVAWLTPRTQEILPLWNSSSESSVALGSWNTLSLTPLDSKLALATLVSYYLLFVTVIQRLQTLNDIERIIKAIALSVLLMGGLGLVQYLTSNGKFLWLYQAPFSDTHFPVKGSFTCRNHFAHFLTLGIGPLLAWIRLSRSPKKCRSTWKTSHSSLFTTKKLLYVGCILLAVAVLMTLSRGGAIAAATATIAVTAYYMRKGLASSNNIYGMAMASLIVIGFLSLGNYDKVALRLGNFTTGSIEDLDNRDARRRVWDANLTSIQEGGFFGAGAGSHRAIYPTYLKESFRKEYTHAENGYLQVVTENGWLGLALLCGIILCALSWCWQAARIHSHEKHHILTGAVIAGILASLVHSAVDFIWFIPACLSLTILLAACALRLAQIGAKEQDSQRTTVINSSWNQPRWTVLAATASIAGFFAISTAWGPAKASFVWDQFLLAQLESNKIDTAQIKTMSSPTTQAKKTNQIETEYSLNELMISQLQNVVVKSPKFARAHARLAARYIERFNDLQIQASNNMPLEQIRNAAIDSKFNSKKELSAWLNRAFGDNSKNLYRAHFHARQALQLCPMEAEAYLHLSKLCFLSGQNQAAITAYVQQSLVLHPKSGNVLLDAGWQYFLLGDLNQALKIWQDVYQQPQPRRLKIAHKLSACMTAANFIQLFQPDWHTLPFVWERYRTLGTADDWQKLLSHAEKMAKKEASEHSLFGTGRIWLKLSKMHLEVENPSEALSSLAYAYQISPDDYSIRRAYGRVLLQTGHFKQAQTHLQWCLARKPDDPRLQSELVKAAQNHYRPHTARTQPNNTTHQ